MLTEKEMFDLILSVANNDERIRAVYMNGSRANPNVVKDLYQDYDIVFMVTETKSFLDDKNWITAFGEPAIIQEPNRENQENYYTWLMLFKDGNRIDLHIRVKEFAIKEYVADSLTVTLLDKDNCLPKIPPKQMIPTITLKDRKNLNSEVVVIISGGVFKMLPKASQGINSPMQCGCTIL